jgi:hypothetical protein
MRTLLVSLLIFLLTGCAVTTAQLKGATTELSASVLDLETHQILENISAFIDGCASPVDCDAIPSQFVLGNGQTQVSNQIQAPNLTANFQGIALKSLAFQDQNQWTQTWSVVPVTDYGDLKRLRLLYQFAVLMGSTSPLAYADFADQYIKLPLAGAPTGYLPINATGTVTGQSSYSQLPMPVPAISDAATVAHAQKWSGPDPSQWPVRLPNQKWIFWDVPGGQQSGTENVGRYGHHVLNVNKKDLRAFTLWVMGATIDTNNTAKGSGGKAPGLLLNVQ